MGRMVVSLARYASGAVWIGISAAGYDRFRYELSWVSNQRTCTVVKVLLFTENGFGVSFRSVS